MSTENDRLALERMARTGAALLTGAAGKGFALYPRGDRRRRPLARMSAAQVRAYETEGVLRRDGERAILTEAGRALVRRRAARDDEAFVAQHRAVVERAVMGASGRMDTARGFENDSVLKRLSRLEGGERGEGWLSAAELNAAARLRADWELGQIGLVRGSDWSAPPLSGAPRATVSGVEVRSGALVDARRRLSLALDALAPIMRRVVERVCLFEEGLESVERGENWPARSAKLALKLGLAQVALAYADKARRASV
jgi:hypothetical protein